MSTINNYGPIRHVGQQGDRYYGFRSEADLDRFLGDPETKAVMADKSLSRSQLAAKLAGIASRLGLRVATGGLSELAGAFLKGLFGYPS